MRRLVPIALLLSLPSFALQSGPLPSLAPLVDSVKSAVINVEVQSRAPANEATPDQLFEWFFGPEGQRQGKRRLVQPPQQQYREGVGSGFIIDPNGLALTNNHVVEGAVSIRVKLDDGRQFDAKVLGRDPLTDVALIKLEGNLGHLPVVTLGDSDKLQVGDWVMAIGNPFGLASSVSTGIVSARARDIHAGPYDDFIQTDAAINPGNSGGPLFDMNGLVVGINTAIVNGGTGIGFAVPANLVKELLPQLEKSGVVTRGYLGIYVQDLNPDLAKALGVPVEKGAVVSQVTPGSPAARAGLKADDVVVALDGEAIGTAGALTRDVAMKHPASRSTLAVYRGAKKTDVGVEIAKRPDLEHNAEPKTNTAQEFRHRLGVTLQDVDPSDVEPGMPDHGAAITQVEPGSPADRAELQPGMVVVEAGGKPVRSPGDLQRILDHAKSGSVVLVRVAVSSGGQGEQGQGGRGAPTSARLLRALKIP